MAPGGYSLTWPLREDYALKARDTFFRLQVYERVGISVVKVFERVGKSVTSVGNKG